MNWSVIFPSLIATTFVFYISEVKFKNYFSRKGMKPSILLFLIGVLINMVTFGIYILIMSNIF
ncbi:hypothetical protein [Staphylococcus haemolyticus]|uniref:hypothetical protein n=1 Tax=Staphylococcus haemolyticus TaxID=1283 RepID=UPI0007355B63|nr:hypothetical protein [Staphylococcus haemolyticus]AYX83226.1 hypothetical protein EGX85_02155 [Staphylococcus haemolyticus]MBW5900665.1 hypothetical protein [Staphylococcus haemolyticus]MCE2377709.1 hypothetical protein [Staphylococcus haemolyticus]MCH4365373.1 hypothetical protein [Staphylococcus haemolyticus]MCH4367684.1 hypothetical protein [Staphylococcus haemolyticus]